MTPIQSATSGTTSSLAAPQISSDTHPKNSWLVISTTYKPVRDVRSNGSRPRIGHKACFARRESGRHDGALSIPSLSVPERRWRGRPQPVHPFSWLTGPAIAPARISSGPFRRALPVPSIHPDVRPSGTYPCRAAYIVVGKPALLTVGYLRALPRILLAAAAAKVGRRTRLRDFRPGCLVGEALAM